MHASVLPQPPRMESPVQCLYPLKWIEVKVCPYRGFLLNLNLEAMQTQEVSSTVGDTIERIQMVVVVAPPSIPFLLVADAEKTLSILLPLHTECVYNICRPKNKRILVLHCGIFSGQRLNCRFCFVHHFISQLQNDHSVGQCHFMGIIDCTTDQVLAVWFAGNIAEGPSCLHHTCYKRPHALQVLPYTICQLFCSILDDLLR